MTTSIPQTQRNNIRVIERPDGFYWQDKITDELCGPFATLLEAMQDMQDQSDTDYEEGESLAEAGADIGMTGWVDPETGDVAEDLQLHLSDE
jgi:hypothetical protein